MRSPAETAARASAWLRMRLLLDRLLALLLLLPAAPVIAALAFLVRRHDGGAGLITVRRVGRGGQTFGMWKLRSMRVDDPHGRATGAALTRSNDDRITPIGRRMRAVHLDELPQLFNVARGEMCLLGPRPEAPEFVDDRADWNAVLTVPPGIAGPTQLIVGDWERVEIDRDPSGRAYETVVVPVKLAIDRWYMEHASPRLDLLVLTSLVGHVLPAGGFARLVQRVDRAVPAARPAVEHLRHPEAKG